MGLGKSGHFRGSQYKNGDNTCKYLTQGAEEQIMWVNSNVTQMNDIIILGGGVEKGYEF